MATLLSLALLLLAGALPLLAQQTDDPPELARAYELETAGKYREAAQIFRTSTSASGSPSALLGLERVYAELQRTDSLLPLLDTLISRQPHQALYRTVQLRTLQILRREDALRAAFDAWVSESPHDETPYREYARILIQLGRPKLADIVVHMSERALGSTHALAMETAQLRAAEGQWTTSATAWREALAGSPYLATAASFALAPAPAPARDSVRSALLVDASPGARNAVAELELGWGRPQEAWDALRAAKPDSAAATAWAEFGDRAFNDERYELAREALTAALRVRRTPELALRAATAALRAGAAADVFILLPLHDAEHDSAAFLRDYLPLHVKALAALGRASEADALVQRYDRALAPGERRRLANLLADAYVRVGDLARARSALAGGGEADSSETAGWLALYEGRLADARVLLRNARDADARLALALGILARTRGDDGSAIGAAFLALARGDSGAAEQRFVEAAERHPEVRPALLLTAARLRDAHGNIVGAVMLWARIVNEAPDSPEFAEAELEWSRTLRQGGDMSGAVSHLEHLILSAPESALLPQARRELDLARAALPRSR